MARAAAAEAGTDTRERILRAALEAFSEKGLDGATTREIAADAPTGPPAPDPPGTRHNRRFSDVRAPEIPLESLIRSSRAYGRADGHRRPLAR